MVAKFKKWMYLCSTRAFVFNFKELHLFVFKEQTILIQLQERFIDSRMLYRFKKIILIQQTFVQESNTTLFLQENYIPNFCFFQEIYIHSTKPIKNIYSFKFSSSQSLSFIFPTNQVPGHRRQKHAFNELGRPYPSWFEIPTHHSIFSTIPSSCTLLHRVQRETRRRSAISFHFSKT